MQFNSQPINQDQEMSENSPIFTFPNISETHTPFSWENEDFGNNAVVFNDQFYSIPEVNLLPPVCEDPMNLDKQLDQIMEDLPECSEENMINDQESVASTDVTSNSGLRLHEKTGLPQETSMDAQLEFIMQSTKKKTKAEDKTKKNKRNRKTKEQLEILDRDITNKSGVTKEKIKQVAKLTGLKELQVYKWYWDHKAKNDPSLSCELDN